jgi:ubiquinone/menaquinone biosynthesis C-methylase UbiE
MFSTPSVNLTQFHIEPGMTVADLGCGSGAYVFEILQRVGPTGKVFALDVQKTLVEKLANECKAKHIINVTALWDDLDDANGIGLQDSSIDRVVIANTLFQIEDVQKFATEVRRILKPKGLALIVDWSDSFGGLGPTPQTVMKKDRALDIFQKAGFEFKKDVNAGDHHYGFVVQCNA